ncbi:hypothetical protein HDE_01901 [Halotydeus destructor]|nr:hypothetical protein HDE_01901 [Halotydeus destructor]
MSMKMPLSLEWLGPQLSNRSTAFLAIKYILLAATSVIILLCLFFFAIILTADVNLENKKYPKVDVHVLRDILITFMVVTIVINGVGVYAVVKEHFCLTLTFAICLLLGCFGRKDDVYAFTINIILTALAFIYAAMLRKIQLRMSHSTMSV